MRDAYDDGSGPNPGGRSRHLFEIDAEGLAQHLRGPLPHPTRVAGSPRGGAGGGWEVELWDDIPPWLIKQVR